MAVGAAPAGRPAVAHAPAAVPRRAHRPVRAAVDLPARHQGLHRHGGAPRGQSRGARGRELHAAADRADRGDRGGASGSICRSAAPLPDPVLALLGPGARAHRSGAAPRAAARLPACAAQADDRALRPVPGAGHDRRDARHARARRATPPISSSTISRSGTTSPGSGRRCGAPIRWSARLTERGRDFTAAQRRDLLVADRRAGRAR